MTLASRRKEYETAGLDAADLVADPMAQWHVWFDQATEAGCVMIIDKSGQLTTTGGHETIILQGEEATPKSRASTAPAPQ